MESSTFDRTAASDRIATGYLPHSYADVAEVAEVPEGFGGHEAAASALRWLTWRNGFLCNSEPRLRSGLAAKILRRPSPSAMHRVRWVEPDWRVSYALTWWATRVGENIYHHHGAGGDHGFLTFVAFNKPYRLGVIALSDSTGHAGTSMIAFEVPEMLVGAALSLSRRRVKAGCDRSGVQAFFGDVRHYNFGGELRVEFRDGGLILATPSTPSMPVALPSVPLAPTHQTHVFTATKGRPAGKQVTFELSESGEVTGFSMAELRYLRH